MKEIKFTKADTIKVIAEVASYIDSLQDEKQYCMTIKEYRKKRSLNANSYAWTLIDKLAEKTGIAKTEIYRSYIKEIGGNNDLLCMLDEAVEDFCRCWGEKGIGWLTELEVSKLDGCTNVRVYYGSSTYDSKQMSRLIDLIVQDCKENDIETMTPDELDRLNREWETING